MSNAVEMPDALLNWMLSHDAPGAWPRGTRVRKLTRDDGDLHGPGAIGTVRGTTESFELAEWGRITAYLVVWDDMPGALAFVHDGGGKRLAAVQP